MLRRIALGFALCLVVAEAGFAQRVVLVSLDGLGAQSLFRDPAGKELRTLHKLVQRGASASGAITAFPSLTAASHSAIWTGSYGNHSGLTANDVPKLPRGEHTFDERGNGFRSDQLSAETIWVAAGRQGVRAVAHQATQAFPFRSVNTLPGSPTAPVVMNSYQTPQHAGHRLVRAADVAPVKGTSWFRWTTAGVPFYLKREGRALRVTTSPQQPGVLVKQYDAEGSPPRGRPLARYFSAGLFVEGPSPAVLYFRLFELSPQDFLLYQSPWQELRIHDGTDNAALVRSLLREAGGTIGNGSNDLLKGEREMEVLELVTRQLGRHAAWLARRFEPRLLQSYLPFPDEFDHDWLGLAAQRDPAALRWRRWGYVMVDRFTEELVRLAGRDGHIIFVSDHGMAAVRKAVNVNTILEKAGLRGQAMHLYNSILVNTKDWKNGVVEPADRTAVIDAAQKALSAECDPETGQPIFVAFFRPETDGPRLGIGGAAGGDLYFDLLPGYAVRNSPITHPIGVHGFYPYREDMHSILIASGPRISRGTRWGLLRTVDVAPLVADLLGIAPPANSTGSSPLKTSTSRRHH